MLVGWAVLNTTKKPLIANLSFPYEQSLATPISGYLVGWVGGSLVGWVVIIGWQWLTFLFHQSGQEQESQSREEGERDRVGAGARSSIQTTSTRAPKVGLSLMKSLSLALEQYTNTYQNISWEHSHTHFTHLVGTLKIIFFFKMISYSLPLFLHPRTKDCGTKMPVNFPHTLNTKGPSHQNALIILMCSTQSKDLFQPGFKLLIGLRGNCI